MAVFRVERNTGYTVMSNHHLRNKELSLKAKGLLQKLTLLRCRKVKEISLSLPGRVYSWRPQSRTFTKR